MRLNHPVPWAAVPSKAVVLLLLIYCFMYFPLIVGVLCLYLFCYALFYVHCRFETILKRKRKLVVLQMYCYHKCSVTLPHGAVGSSAVCDCGIIILIILTYFLFWLNILIAEVYFTKKTNL